MNKEKTKCMYCNEEHDGIIHFKSHCCGRGMCETCYGNLEGTTEQIQEGYFDDDDSEYDLPDGYGYICFEHLHRYLIDSKHE